ncbi:MAG: hypothetical protein IJM90_00620 [Firmicutes bacterium]|nr:hypothetical protein [Bacillota bacterium]
MGAVLGVILTILKWIGIILLWIIGIVLGLILLVILLLVIFLSIPIRVSAEGEYTKEKTEVEAHVTYCLKLLHVQVFFKEKILAWQVKLFGKVLASSGREASAEEEKPTGNPAAEEEAKPAESPAAEEAAKPAENPALQDQEPAEASASESPADNPSPQASEQSTGMPTMEIHGPSVKPKPAEPEEPQEEEIPDWAKECMKPIGPDLEDKISAKIGELEEKFGGILAKADTYYQEFRFYPEKRQVMKALGRMLWRIIRQFRFRDTRLWLRLGLDDPSATGLILGAAGMLNHMIPSKELSLLLQPEFGQSLIEGGGTLHLRIRIQAFIHAILCFLLNRYILRLIFYVIRRLRKSRKKTGSKADQKELSNRKDEE